MVKTLESQSVVYTLRVDNPNGIANFNQGALVASVSKDLAQFGERGVQGVAVQVAEAARLVETAKKDMIAKKLQRPLVRAGVSGDDLIFQVTDQANSSYEKVSVLVPHYKSLKAKLAQQKATLVNMQKGDPAVERAVRLVGAKLGQGQDAATVKLNERGDTAPIVLVAHGASERLSSGTVVGTEFAGKSADDIVRWLAETKKLALNYAGCIYLDGCYTAAGNDSAAFAKRVYDGLVRKGYRFLQVKGNPGRAAPTPSGAMKVLHSEVEKELADKVRAFKALWDRVWSAKYAARNDVDGFFRDPEIAAIRGQFSAAKAQFERLYRADSEKRIEGLVGSFGPEALKKDARFRRLFGLR